LRLNIIYLEAALKKIDMKRAERGTKKDLLPGGGRQVRGSIESDSK
jgi:hypothetical protein